MNGTLTPSHVMKNTTLFFFGVALMFKSFLIILPKVFPDAILVPILVF